MSEPMSRHSVVYVAAWKALQAASGGSIESRVAQAIADGIEAAMAWVPPTAPAPSPGSRLVRRYMDAGEYDESTWGVPPEDFNRLYDHDVPSFTDAGDFYDAREYGF